MQTVNFAGISARDIVVWRGDRKVLDRLSLEAAAGDCIHVAGPNGSGKTTLLRVLAGFLHPERGNVCLGGRPLFEDTDAFHASFSYLSHSDGLKPELTAQENLAFGVGLRRRLAPTDINTALSQVGLEASSRLPTAVLSAGQKRRLAMARVVLAGSPLWILDEPFTNLDSAGVALVSALIAARLETGGAVLLASHQPPQVANHPCHRVALA